MTRGMTGLSLFGIACPKPQPNLQRPDPSYTVLAVAVALLMRRNPSISLTDAMAMNLAYREEGFGRRLPSLRSEISPDSCLGRVWVCLSHNVGIDGTFLGQSLMGRNDSELSLGLLKIPIQSKEDIILVTSRERNHDVAATENATVR